MYKSVALASLSPHSRTSPPAHSTTSLCAYVYHQCLLERSEHIQDAARKEAEGGAAGKSCGGNDEGSNQGRHKCHHSVCDMGRETRLLLTILYSGGVHKSKDPRDHATVDYKTSDGTHITTKHVHMEQP